MADHLPIVEQNVLAHASVVALAEALQVPEVEAAELLERAWDQGRVAILGDAERAGVTLDGQWIVIRGRAWLRQAAQEYLTLEFMERQFED
jgi:hypothetical protein